MKTSKAPLPANTLPGVCALTATTLTLVRANRPLFIGYAAWMLLPALFLFIASFLSLGEFGTFFVENALLLVDLILSLWITGSLNFAALLALRNKPLLDVEISTRVRERFSLLVYLLASFVGIFLLTLTVTILPGVLLGAPLLIALEGIVLFFAFLFFATGVTFSFLFAIDNERMSFVQTFRAGFALIRGRFLSAFLRMLGFTFFLGLFLALALTVIFGALALLGFFDFGQALSDLTLTGSLPAWMNLLISAITIPFLPYSAAFDSVLYEALKKA